MATDSFVKKKATPKKAGRHVTAEEAAQAKTDYAWNTVLKNVDWNKLDELRKNK